MIDRFFNTSWNIGKAILIWALIGFALIEIVGCSYVNFFQKDPNAPVDPPSISRAKYEVYVKANNRTMFSNDVDQAGSVVTLNGYYVLQGDKFKYVKGDLTMDRTYFGEIEVTKR